VPVPQPPVPTVVYSKALKIDPSERDWKLETEKAQWPTVDPDPQRWRREDGYLRREIALDPKAPKDGGIATPLTEFMLRFPSAPIHGVQRLGEHHSGSQKSLNFHTYRILMASPDPQRQPPEPQKITRLFLFHNGLNELDRFGLYYRLASYLINEDTVNEDTETACIMHPFPGHLTRAPFAHFAERPLQRYLWDGSHLFQQFLRYMVETRWFLSALVRRSDYPCLAGATLLASDPDPDKSRLDPAVLADAIFKEFVNMSDPPESRLGTAASGQTETRETAEQSNNCGLQTAIRTSVLTLQDVLKLDKHERLGTTFTPEQREPAIHMIGYSLGGFAAQSAFMSWPFVIASCSTLLSGGALRELAPTAFADPEEWQTVLHSLRYELDDGMLDRRYGGTSVHIAGVERRLFHYFQRTFYEVFQQEYRGSFRTRLAAYRRRMLFVVGGDDSIVRTESVLQSAPPGGINLLEIGGLSHFIDSDPGADKQEEQDQRTFWLPQVGKLMHSFSNDAANQQRSEHGATWGKPRTGDDAKPNDPPALLTRHRRIAVDIPQDGALASAQFDWCIDDMLHRLGEKSSESDADGGGSPGARHSRLILSRNELPAVLLDLDSVQERARAFHHDEPSIKEYCDRTLARGEVLRGAAPQVKVLLPWNAYKILSTLESEHGFPSQSETASGHMPRPDRERAVWKAFEETCDALSERNPCVAAIYDGKDALVPGKENDAATKLLAQQQTIHKGELWVPSLPDCWVWLSGDYLGKSGGKPLTPERVDTWFMECVSELYSDSDDSKQKEEEENALGDLELALRADKLRIVTVSRARYNSRFRGRLVVDPKAAKQILTHVALCLAAAKPADRTELESMQKASQKPPVPQASGG
jgi:hypothetical protein